MILIGRGRCTIGLKLTPGEWLLWIVIVFCSIEFNVSETSTPLSLAGVYGERAQLNCSVESNRKILGEWQYRNPYVSQSEDESLYHGEVLIQSFEGSYSIDSTEKGCFNLVIKELSKNTSGRYTCFHDEFLTSNSPEYGAQVIALDAKPACSAEYTSDSVTANCSIGFSGFWSPELEWRNAKGIVIKNATETTINSTVTSSVILQFDKDDPPEKYTLTCTPKFTQKNRPTDTTAENLPEFPYNCTAFDQNLKPPRPPVQNVKNKPTIPGPGGRAHDPNSTPPASVSVSVHDGPSPYLCMCFVTSVFIVMLQKWYWEVSDEVRKSKELRGRAMI